MIKEQKSRSHLLMRNGIILGLVGLCFIISSFVSSGGQACDGSLRGEILVSFMFALQITLLAILFVAYEETFSNIFWCVRQAKNRVQLLDDPWALSSKKKAYLVIGLCLWLGVAFITIALSLLFETKLWPK